VKNGEIEKEKIIEAGELRNEGCRSRKYPRKRPLAAIRSYRVVAQGGRYEEKVVGNRGIAAKTTHPNRRAKSGMKKAGLAMKRIRKREEGKESAAKGADLRRKGCDGYQVCIW